MTKPVPLKELLPVRAFNILARQGIHFLDDLLKYSAGDLLDLPGFGTGTLVDVIESLNRLGKKLPFTSKFFSSKYFSPSGEFTVISDEDDSDDADHTDDDLRSQIKELRKENLKLWKENQKRRKEEEHLNAYKLAKLIDVRTTRIRYRIDNALKLCDTWAKDHPHDRGAQELIKRIRSVLTIYN